MQTIKTAAIFIFMATVIYGAYTSLTTPPETLPDDVKELMFDHEPDIAFDEDSFDAGMAESLPDLDIHTGTPTDVGENNAEAVAWTTSDSAGLETVEDPSANAVAAIALPSEDVAVTARLSDSPSSAASAANAQLSATPNPFNLPDPNQLATDFSPSGKDLGLPKVDSNLALTSGTSDSGLDRSLPTGDQLASGVVHAAPNISVSNALKTADRQYLSDQRKEALATLSIFYNTPDLSGEERAGLLARLDPLAREVIYSTEHLLEKPYRVGQSETLVDIAAKYDVPWQLLANINRVDDPMTLLPGTELKVVTGPFRAEIALSRQELTLFLGDLYAGRFPIAIGSDPPPQPGSYTIQDKQAEHTYYNRAGSPIPPGNAANPYGSAWMDLGGQLSIHGSPDPRQPTDQGCVSLADNLAIDLYGILSQGSAVTIQR